MRIAPLENGFATILKAINDIIGNYGIAIIILTILVRLVIYPLTLKQEQSMEKMKDMQPEIDKIREKYKNDSQQMNIKIQELYKSNNINPAAGCLPMIIQLPILFSLYGVFGNKFFMLPEIKSFALLGGNFNSSILLNNVFYNNYGKIPANTKFLWMNLTDIDPYFILAFLTAILTIIQQVYTSTTQTNSLNKKKLMITGAFIFLTCLMLALTKGNAINIAGFKIESFMFVVLMALATLQITKFVDPEGQTSQQSAAGPNMESMLYIMPFLMLGFATSLPSAVQVYWFTSTLIGVLFHYIKVKRKSKGEN